MYNENMGKIKDRMILYQIQVVILLQRGKIMETVEMFLFHKVSGTCIDNYHVASYIHFLMSKIFYSF